MKRRAFVLSLGAFALFAERADAAPRYSIIVEDHRGSGQDEYVRLRTVYSNGRNDTTETRGVRLADAYSAAREHADFVVSGRLRPEPREPREPREPPEPPPRPDPKPPRCNPRLAQCPIP